MSGLGNYDAWKLRSPDCEAQDHGEARDEQDDEQDDAMPEPTEFLLWAVEYRHNSDDTLIVVPGLDAEDATGVAEMRLSLIDRFPDRLEPPRIATDDDIDAHDLVLAEIERAQFAQAARDEERSW